MDLIGQRGFEERFQGRAVDDAPAHGVEIRLLIDLAPVNALLQTALEHQIKPDAGAASVALHEGVGDVHFHILVDYLVEAGLRHTLDGGQDRGKMQRVGEGETALADVLAPDLPGEIVQAAEDVGVDLLQTLDGSGLQGSEQTAFEQGVRLGAAFAVDGIFAVCQPLDEWYGVTAGDEFDQREDILLAHAIGEVALPIGSGHFQLTTACSQLRVFLLETALQHAPILARTGAFGQDAHDVGNRKEPLRGIVIPRRPDFPVIEKPYGDLAHVNSSSNSWSFPQADGDAPRLGALALLRLPPAADTRQTRWECFSYSHPYSYYRIKLSNFIFSFALRRCASCWRTCLAIGIANFLSFSRAFSVQ